MTNPYEAPTYIRQVELPHHNGIARITFFALNFSVGLLLLVSCVIAIITATYFAPFLGGIILFPPVLIYTAVECVAFVSRSRVCERALGYANLAGAVFATFGVISNIGEAVMGSERPAMHFFLYFTLVGGAIIAYMTACGFYRLRSTRKHARK
jgi:hypothetical protein